MNNKLRFFVMIVYNNFIPRNTSNMYADLRFALEALIAMSED